MTLNKKNMLFWISFRYLLDIQATHKAPERTLKKYADTELIDAILKTGDNVFFGELYDRYSDKVYGKCILMVKIWPSLKIWHKTYL